MPDNEYRSYFAPDYRLHIPVWPDLENLNTLEYLEQVQRKVFMHLSRWVSSDLGVSRNFFNALPKMVGALCKKAFCSIVQQMKKVMRVQFPKSLARNLTAAPHMSTRSDCKCPFILSSVYWGPQA